MKTNNLTRNGITAILTIFYSLSCVHPQENILRHKEQAERFKPLDETTELNSGNDLGSPRLPKQFLLYLQLRPLANLARLQLAPRTSASTVECYTRKGNEGNCTTFKECFPLETYEEDEEMGPSPDHTALMEEMFNTAKSPGCVSRLNSLGDVEKIICCPLPKTSKQKQKVVISSEEPKVFYFCNKTSTDHDEFPGEQTKEINSENSSKPLPIIQSETTKPPSSPTTTVDSMDKEATTIETITDANFTGNETTINPDAFPSTSTTNSATTGTNKIITTVSPTQTVHHEVKITNSLAAQCGRVKVYPFSKFGKITGGKEAYKGEFPWMVAIFGKNRKHTCGGSLLNSQYVLTASHCLATYNSNDVAQLSVTIGDHNIKTTGDGFHETRRVSQVILHKGFDIKTYFNDVALLRLDRPVTFTNYIQPICLPKANSSGNIDGADVVVVAGWGRDRSYGFPAATLRKVNIPIWKQSECQRVYDFFAPGRLTEKSICAGDGKRNKDACIGDSGGPLMQLSTDGAWHQIGIVSWGKGCGSFPGVYTRVDHFLHWIQRNMQI